MAYTCRQFVEAAFEEIGLGSTVIDLQPEDLQYGLRRLDAMMATWNGLGIRLGYPIAGSPTAVLLDVSSNVPDSANEAVIANLAIRIAPKYGKSILPETYKAATSGYDVLMARAAMPKPMTMTTIPRGAGYKRFGMDNFIPQKADPLNTGPEGELDLY